ncbi:N-acetyltransferase family protein [Maritalea sp.]|uniref:GNAT family N-acetyltransferase n=1 Tax=Maritalea sp. TaxID=2003361 RepID=UPI003EF4F012
MTIELRAADARDIDEIAALFLRSRQVVLPFLPILHSAQQDRAHMRDMLERGIINVATLDQKIVGFLVDLDGWIAHLYLDPDFLRQGIGEMLLAEVKRRRKTLELWCFQQNWAARSFYEKNGFICVRETDGDNEEKLPDRLYRWQKET